jgi:hypothetical protein
MNANSPAICVIVFQAVSPPWPGIMIDLEKVLQELRSRHQSVERAIVQLEELIAAAEAGASRGGHERKSVGETELPSTPKE